VTRRIEYYEQEDGRQPAEEFEDALFSSGSREERSIAAKLQRWAELAAEKGHLASGGYVEKVHGYPFWQLKADVGNRRGREFFHLDDESVVLLSGVVKGPREATPPGAYEEAKRYFEDYEKTGRVSPEEPEE
jgi:hypothetical protein